MKLQTKIPIIKAATVIDYNSKILLVGSCFAQNLGVKLAHHKFQIFENPLGILFHPKAIAKMFRYAITQEKYTDADVFFLNERWHCFDVHSSLSNPSKDDLLATINGKLEELSTYLKTTTHIVLTLGTAWGYRHMKTQNFVANCHKTPQQEFSKELSPAMEIEESLQKIITLVHTHNSKVKFILTVSPIRHLKDGFVENQRGKSHLIGAVHHTVNSKNVTYFPAYEVMMDELRDYRFYGEDMIHPNQTAVDYIWERFKATWISEKVYAVLDEIAAIQKGLQHRPFNEKSKQHQFFLKGIAEKITNIRKTYPHIIFET